MATPGELQPRAIAPAAHSLLRVIGATEHGEQDQRWVFQTEFDPAHFTDLGISKTCGLDTPLFSFTDGAGCADESRMAFRPFMVFIGLPLSGLQAANELQKYQERAKRSLLFSQSSGIAREIWLGEKSAELWAGSTDTQATDGNKRLSSSAWTDEHNNGAAVDAIAAMAALETENGKRFGGVGLIHAPRELFVYWASLDIIRDLGNGLYTTPLGTTVISDPGYDIGYDLDGVDPGLNNGWAYLSGPLDIHLGSVESHIDLTQTAHNNTPTILAKRYVSVVWSEPNNYGVNVNICNATEACS